jgi:hypothetical protein
MHQTPIKKENNLQQKISNCSIHNSIINAGLPKQNKTDVQKLTPSSDKRVCGDSFSHTKFQ